MLIQLQDGAITNIREEHWNASSGCDTCHFGSSYVQDFTIETTGGNMEFHLDQMYDYPISHQFLFELFIGRRDEIMQMSLAQFYSWLREQFDSQGDGLATLRHYEVTGSWNH